MPDTPRLDSLLIEVRKCCDARRGRKAALARYLGARPHQINEWLTNYRCKPSTEYALGMAEWLEAQAVERTG